MNILILSASHPFRTAGIVAYDIYKGFKAIKENNVRMVVKIWDTYDDVDILTVDNYFTFYKSRIINKFTKKLNLNKLFNKVTIQTNPDYHVQDIDQTIEYYSTESILRRAKIKPDIIFVIFAQGFLNYKNIYELNKLTKAPIYWLLADMAPFTGCCHYAWECPGYKSECGNCPAIYSQNLLDISSKNLSFKNLFIKDIDLRIIVPSEWLFHRAKSSSLFREKKISKVLLSVNEDQFYPNLDKIGLKKKYNIDEDFFIIGFGANGLKEKRKGIRYILDAINILKTNRKILFLYAGDQLIKEEYPYPVKYLGKLDRKDLSDFYNLCDIFLSASLQDVGPYMIVEALMCGTPVISFNTGIASDYVITNKTGVLIETFSVHAITDGINKMLKMNKNDFAHMKNICYKNTKMQVSLEKQIDNYYSLFKEDNLIK
jgi:glycosyltransferase involved in cell wall biosynthesis